MRSDAERREAMVVHDIAGRGVTDPRVLDAMRRVAREYFVDPEVREQAYDDSPLAIEEGQTISQPYIVAFMAEALQLRGGERVLEVGTGSGYAAAVLAELAEEVFTIERHAGLARSAARRLARLGYTNIYVRHADGMLGWPEAAPFYGISVAAGGREAPEPLLDQLDLGGRLVIPLGDSSDDQALVCIRRISDREYLRQDLGPVRFVPLVSGTSTVRA